MENSKLHVAILSSPGMGHLIPVLNLGNRLLSHHNVDITILLPATNSSPAESKVLKPLTDRNQLNIIEIPPVDISSLVNPKTTIVTQLCIMMRAVLPGLRSTIAAMNPRPDVLIVDLFGTEALPVADEFDMPKYVYIASTAWFTALTTYCPVLDEKIEGQYVDQRTPLKIPGCKPVRPEDVVDPMLDRNDEQYREYLRLGIEFRLSDGILLNTWEDLEPISLKALRENGILRAVVKVPVYDIGPLRRPAEPAGSKSRLIEWLDVQPSESVIYISFGSGGTLSAQQINELAWGLEMSQQRFVWVVRPPTEGGADGSFFTVGNGSDGTLDYLPDGFLSHCGWNSTLESIASGIPMIAWPLYAEQRLNATMLTEELGVAVRPEVLPTKKVVGREEIEKMVRTLMQYTEGKAMRDRVKELKHSAEKALSNEGSSYKSMAVVLEDCQRRVQSHKKE
ncbi:unnamed protein product [Ilex paraguariensis]|uniref:Glycosyltransferase n=1 Tax=Ilex paraguariensis TaxID=185542 RepID=A0ABC8SDP3_9AQUA